MKHKKPDKPFILGLKLCLIGSSITVLLLASIVMFVLVCYSSAWLSVLFFLGGALSLGSATYNMWNIGKHIRYR